MHKRTLICWLLKPTAVFQYNLPAVPNSVSERNHNFKAGISHIRHSKTRPAVLWGSLPGERLLSLRIRPALPTQATSTAQPASLCA